MKVVYSTPKLEPLYKVRRGGVFIDTNGDTWLVLWWLEGTPIEVTQANQKIPCVLLSTGEVKLLDAKTEVLQDPLACFQHSVVAPPKHFNWELAEQTQKEVDKWPEWKKNVADWALTSTIKK